MPRSRSNGSGLSFRRRTKPAGKQGYLDLASLPRASQLDHPNARASRLQKMP
jgi:hypothetical protein